MHIAVSRTLSALGFMRISRAALVEQNAAADCNCCIEASWARQRILRCAKDEYTFVSDE